MTHSLHRLGNPQNLKEDIIVFAMSAKGINEEGSCSRMKRFMEIAFELDPINAGDMKTGNILTHSRDEILDGIQDVSIVHAVFDNEEIAAQLIRRVKDEELGLSVVVSGPFDIAKCIGEKAGVRQHTIECSGGVWGRVERLPDSDVMQITTMCGHGMIASKLVENLARSVRLERQTPDEAALELARPCVCGIFNPKRAAKLLEYIAERQADGGLVAAGQTSVSSPTFS